MGHSWRGKRSQQISRRGLSRWRRVNREINETRLRQLGSLVLSWIRRPGGVMDSWLAARPVLNKNESILILDDRTQRSAISPA